MRDTFWGISTLIGAVLAIWGLVRIIQDTATEGSIFVMIVAIILTAGGLIYFNTGIGGTHE